jgi:hypothetical protein
MVSITKTIQEARDHILKRVNALDKTNMQTLVLEFLNLALIDIVTSHNWELLQRKATLTYSTNADNALVLPSNCDRIIVIKSTSQYKLPMEGMSPREFETTKSRYDFTEPKVYCGLDFAQSTTANAPYQRIEIYNPPANGDTFTCWYIQHFTEFETTDLGLVPNIPPPIWRLVIKAALIETLEYNEADKNTIQFENAKLLAMAQGLKSREKHKTSAPREIKSTEKYKDWLAYRKSKL